MSDTKELMSTRTLFEDWRYSSYKFPEFTEVEPGLSAGVVHIAPLND